MPSTTVENYLKQILLLEQEAGPGGRVPMGRVAAALAVVPGTVTTMVKGLADRGLAEYEPRVGVSLTPEGRRLALQMVRRHRLIELFLVQSLGLSWTEIHEEAERLEHAISDRVLERLDAMLGHPSFDPHGDPIPDASGDLAPQSLTPLSKAEPGCALRLVRITDQDRDFLLFVESLGLTPGVGVRVEGRDPRSGRTVVVLGPGRRVVLEASAGVKILVEPKHPPG